jgi:inosine/xanthosine triphosphatase
MVTVAVGSTNDDKLEAMSQLFSEYFEEVNVNRFNIRLDTEDNLFHEKAFFGAEHRAKEVTKLTKRDLKTEFCVGIEGGPMKLFGRWFQVDYVYMIKEDRRSAFGIAPSFELPQAIVEEMQKGTPLKNIVDRVSSTNNGSSFGVLNYLSEGRVNYVDQLIQGGRMALVPLLNEKIFYSKTLPTTMLRT